MLYYNRIDLNEGMDVAKSINNEECVICHYWYLIMGPNFKIQSVMVATIW